MRLYKQTLLLKYAHRTHKVLTAPQTIILHNEINDNLTNFLVSRSSCFKKLPNKLQNDICQRRAQKCITRYNKQPTCFYKQIAHFESNERFLPTYLPKEGRFYFTFPRFKETYSLTSFRHLKGRRFILKPTSVVYKQSTCS